MRGRDWFILGGRVVPLGVPLGLGVGTWSWSRERRIGRAIVLGAMVIALTWLEAEIEFHLRRGAHRRRQRDAASRVSTL
jgi:hypothetical protein